MGRRVEPTDVHIGRRIRQARLAAGISQTVLADAIGLTFQQVQKYEKGANRVGGARLQAIAAKLNKPIAWFYEGAPQAKVGKAIPSDDPILALGQTRLGMRMARAFVALDHSQQDALVSMAEVFAASPVRQAKAA